MALIEIFTEKYQHKAVMDQYKKKYIQITYNIILVSKIIIAMKAKAHYVCTHLLLPIILKVLTILNVCEM